MSSSKSKRRVRSTRRFTSNVFSMYNDAQISEFKEAFNVIDTNKDGFIDRNDLIEMYRSLGKEVTASELKEMLPDDQINFMQFLTMFGEKMIGSDPQESIVQAFENFDPDKTGFIDTEKLREVMTTLGTVWTDDEVSELFASAPITRDNKFNYREFVNIIVRGDNDKDKDSY
ncbi:Myosin regulatory light chain 12B [Cichlidogyrus casuarinus]|uniref:Myosin regulatory light chain 12B n=1 Tax=Cichlidogyrus casuarinus TaxID=1844966 RepID=A0ABD2QF77_9PLAT